MFKRFFVLLLLLLALSTSGFVLIYDLETSVPIDLSGSEDCLAGESDQSPLFDHQIYLTTSPDGRTFDPQGTLVLEHGSVPDVVMGPDGALWVYFVNGQPGQHGIFAARQLEGGTWEIVDCVKLDGQFNGNAVDPNITRLPDGRYRLVYYLGNFVEGGSLKPGDPHPIYSAISDDGIHFAVEGRLIAVDDVTDPSLLQLPDGNWLLAMTRPDETLLAFSRDGLKFELTGVVVEERGIPELGLLPDGRIALYIGRMYISSDGGQTWILQPDVHVPGGGADPSLTPLPEGGFAFAYKTFSTDETRAKPEASSIPLQGEFTPCSGFGEPVENEQGKIGPWASRLMIAFSEDGLNFTRTNQIFADQSDVPDVLIMPNGEIRAYFVTMCPDEVRNQIVVAVSKDAVNWVYKKVILTNMDEIQPIAVDPTVEFTPQGQIRLYFTSSPAYPDSSPQSYSAISKDGYTFEMESGPRFGVEGAHVLDPTVLQIGDTWHYFGGGMPGINYHATSPDGLNFTRQDDLQIDRFLFANGLAVEGGYRYYGFVQEPGTPVASIYSVFTDDGITWQLDDGVRLEVDESAGLESYGVKDPAVAQLPDGRYLMIYSTVIPEYPYEMP